MKWERDGTWWVAKGKHGAFYVRKKGGVWRAHYLNFKTMAVVWLRNSETVAEAKRKCEYNYRWEIVKRK